MAGIRVAHVSDLHAHEAGKAALPIIKAAIEDLKQLSGEKPIDLVLFTGDLGNTGQADDFKVAHDRFIGPLLEQLDLLPERLVLVPGNHDVDRGRINRYEEKGLRSELIDGERVAELMRDTRVLAGATERLDAWNTYYEQVMDGVNEKEIASLARVRELDIGGLSIGIASLNSAWRSADNDDKGFLLLGEEQYDGALAQIRDCDLRIVAMHHPLHWLADFDANTARDAFEGASTLVLSGHEHETDPTAEFSLRGSAVYSRAGCLYEKPKSLNAFTLIDIDPEQRLLDFHLRRWYSAPRNTFDQATELAKGGAFTVDWPREAKLPVKASYSSVLDVLASNAAELCVLATVDREIEISTPEDVLVEPRLWPLPYKEIAAARDIEGAEEPAPSDPMSSLDRTRVLVIIGEPESGVSGTLIWLLTRHFELRGTHTPVPAVVGKKLNERKFEKKLRHSLNSVGVRVEGDHPLPPMLLAIDDLNTSSDLARLGKYISTHKDHLFVLGCHEDGAEALEKELVGRETEFEALHVGPLGRAQVRSLIEKSGSVSTTEIDRIFALIVNEHLPRTPLIIAALIVVVQDQQDPTSYNPSALLNGCINVLLTMDIGADPIEMDLRQREVLLSWLAGQMAREGLTRLTPLEAEEALARYFRDRGLDQWQSPGQVIESHLARSLLVRDNEGIGFRHQAMMDLFAGKRITHEPEFAKEVLESPLRYEEPIRHAAGITRNDKELLSSIQGQSASFLKEVGEDFDVELFDRIKDRQGWSDEDPDLEDLKKAIAARSDEPEENEDDRDERLDRIYDDFQYDDDPGEPPEHLAVLAPYVTLLSGVLRNSELVADVELKENALRDAIHGWSLATIVMALEEDQSADIRERMESEAAREVIESTGEDEESMARLTELIIVMMMVVAGTSSLASPHLETVARKVLEDEEFMDPTAHALFATLFYALMRFPDWINWLIALYETHSEHPIVKELVISLALSAYRSPRISDAEAEKLENFIAGLGDARGPTGKSATVRKMALEDRLQQIRASRQKALMAGALKGGDESL